MYLCSGTSDFNHTEICSEEKFCPLCDLMREIVEEEQKIGKLQDLIDEKDLEIERLTEMLKSVDLVK